MINEMNVPYFKDFLNIARIRPVEAFHQHLPFFGSHMFNWNLAATNPPCIHALHFAKHLALF